MDDVLIIGGGVIGLSLAYELSRHGVQSHVVDQSLPGQEASWAGAGILPPGNRTASHPYDQLVGLSFELHPRWSAELKAETGIDNGYHRCGGLSVARTEAGLARLAELAEEWRSLNIPAEKLSTAEIKSLEPAVNAESIREAYHVPDESQLRNPRHLKALLAACHKRGVRISTDCRVDDFEIRDGRVLRALVNGSPISASSYCICGGAWSGPLAKRLGATASIRPIRGQMVLLACPTAPISRVVNEGKRYLVPRRDGRILVGSTEEDVGFVKRNTAEAVQELLSTAIALVPSLRDAMIERTWSGLRPGPAGAMPLIGRLPGADNAFIAAGHYRAGLQMSPGTAVVMSELIRGQSPQIDLSPFQPLRPQGAA